MTTRHLRIHLEPGPFDETGILGSVQMPPAMASIIIARERFTR